MRNILHETWLDTKSFTLATLLYVLLCAQPDIVGLLSMAQD